jgi:hypothetical protein
MFFFYLRTVRLGTVKVYYSPTNAQVFVLKTISDFTLKFLFLRSLTGDRLVFELVFVLGKCIICVRG